MGLTDNQRDVLRAFCDTIVPSLPRAEDPDGFWARQASDIGVPIAAEQLIDGIPDPTIQAGLGMLLDGLGAQGFSGMSTASREQVLSTASMIDPAAAQGIAALRGMTLFLHYGMPVDPQTGFNPNWSTFGYPGPISAPPQVPKPIDVHVPSDGEVLEADVCIVGSGAGGCVIAGELAAHGFSVVVLEAGGYSNESDFLMLELDAYQQRYWRGGPQATADGNVSLQAGAGLGGGTVINWTNCLRTFDHVREQWAREHGLEGVDGPEYDEHLDAVLARSGATEEASDLNGPQQRMREGCEALGWGFQTVVRNTDLERYSPDTAGYIGFGDQTGSKNSADRTFLADAVERGTRVLVRTAATRVLTENGRAAGVEAVYTPADGGAPAALTVRSAQVVVAGGALESPALLLRSGIGGPAAGQYLRLHPSIAFLGVYAEDQRAWWGPPHAGLSAEFADTGGGYGFLIEAAHYSPALIGSALPFTTAAEHKALVHDVKFGATTIALIRDHGHGQVTLGAAGEAVPSYSLSDPTDVANAQLAVEKIARLNRAAGAVEIAALAEGLPRWRRGEDIDAFVAAAQRPPLRAGGYKLFSAHQMGTCRMGADPQTSVASPFGELHDVRGVWIGDGSAFPTPSGTNPMISIMALARRTAGAIATAAEPGRAALSVTAR